MKNKCKCGNNDETEEYHTCPYAEDVGGDSDAICKCCGDCEYECAQDI
jgi:hypothetical protein